MARNTISFVSTLLFVLHLSLSSARAAPDEDVLFDASSLDDYMMPDSCSKDGLSYCFDKGEDYPDEKIEELLKDMTQLAVEAPEPSSIGSRNGDTYDEPDCPANSTTKPIYYIIDENDNVRVVVQSLKKFQQIYSVKWCLNEGRITKDTPHFLRSTTLEQFKIECINTKMNYDFLVLSQNQLAMELARAKGGIPVCCRCRYNADK